MVVEALDAGKHVFVEKPLAIDEEGLQQVCDAYERSDGLQLMVGFNRRFAPHIEKAAQLLRGRTGPLCMSMVVNAGFIPPDHWTQDPLVGGGRIVGEGCHWIDLMSFLAGQLVTDVHADDARDPATAHRRDDCTTISLKFADGSIGSLHYFANGHRSFPKERLTVFADGKVLELDNFRVLRGYGWSNFRQFKTWSQDKGHAEECRRFMQRVSEGGPPLIPFEQLENVTRISLLAAHPESATQRDGDGESRSKDSPMSVNG